MGNRILLADDSITIQKVVNLTFADEGIEVVAVSNGDMAERRLSEVNPDLVLADIFMPGKNGYELCESIKKSPQFHNVPVVLLVGAFEPFDQAEARRVHADAHLTKPFESRTLVETVRKLITTTDQGRAGTPAQSPSADGQAQRQAEEQASGSTALPSRKPDFSTMTDQAEPHRAAPVASEQATIAQGPGKIGHADSIPSLEVQLGSEPYTESYQEQPDFSSASSWVEQSDAIAPAGNAQEASFDPLDLAAFEDSARELVDAPSTVGFGAGNTNDSMSGFENVSLDLEVLESDLPSRYEGDDQGMILDLERTEPAYAYEGENGAGYDRASGRTSNLTTGGLQSETAQASSHMNSDAFKTQMLETPPGLSQTEERINTNPLEMPSAPDFSRSSVAHSGYAELYKEEALSSTLLAVDDPLGDVLMDEQEIDALSYEARSSSQALFAEPPANEEFNLEFIPQEREVFDIPQSRATAARVTGELTEPAAPSFEVPPAVIDTVEQAAEPYAPREKAVVESQAIASNESGEPSSGFESFTTTSEPTEIDVSASAAESAFEFSTDFQLATPERYSDHVAYTFDNLKESHGEGGETEPATEFTTSAMWSDEETRFAPIDIEATPVSESEPVTGTVERDSFETGFEFAQVMGEGPSPAADAPVANAPVVDAPVAEAAPDAQSRSAETAVESRPAETAAQTGEVSEALVDEIVRRVVAQMSESVVREVAWEVVPDVVERVIKEMAREEVSKRI